MTISHQISILSKTFPFSSGCQCSLIKGKMSTIVLSKYPWAVSYFTGTPACYVNRNPHTSVSAALSFSSSTPSSSNLKVLCRRNYSSNTSKASLVGKTSSNCSSQTVNHAFFSSHGQSVHGTKLLPISGIRSSFRCTMADPFPVSRGHGHVFSGLLFSILVCYCSSSGYVHAEEPKGGSCKEQKYTSSLNTSHGKPVYTDYSIIGIPGDGRCLFRSVAHGACLRSGTSPPSEILQRELADELRARVADEFIKRREETEWFIEGDFDCYVERMRKPHVWGGEPELLMLSHVLRTPITVYMRDEEAGGLISIAEYGQEYGNKENPIKVMYHGFGHYDALLIPGRSGAQSRL